MNTRRRMFLRGLSGAALSIPFLPSLTREARAAGPAPRRFLMMLSHYGTHPDYWYPTMEPTTQVAPGVRSLRLADVPQSLSKTLAPFDDLRAKTTILRGFDVLGDSGWHINSAPSCASTTPKVAMPAFFGHSIDIVLSQSKAVYPQAPVVPYVLATPQSPGDPYWQTSSWNNGKQLNPTASKPAHMLANLFVSGDQPGADGKKRLRLKMIDQVRSDYLAVSKGTRISAEDRRRLDNFAQLTSELDERLRKVGPACARPAERAIASGQPNELYHSNMIDLMVAALACDSTRIISYSMTYGNCFSTAATRPPEELHSAAHASGDRPDAAARQNVYNNWIAARFAELCRKLDQLRDSDGKTLLDNSIAYYSMCQSHGAHNGTSMPVLVCGGAGGRLRTGEYIDFRQRDAAGSLIPIKDPTVVVPRLPGSTAGRPINELLITFMRAMGLQPQDWHRDGLSNGFGHYDEQDVAGIKKYYQPFLGGDREEPVPHYFLG